MFSFVGTVGLLGFALAVNITSTDSFGNAGTSNNVPGWVEIESNGQNARVEESTNRSGSATREHARLRNGASITKTVSTVGYNNIVLKYYWRGDDRAESSDHLLVQWKRTASSTFTTLNSHNASIDSWSSEVSAALPASANNTSIDIRFVGDTNSSSEEVRVDDVTVTGDNASFTLNVMKSGTSVAGGTVTSDVGSINCGAVCSAVFDAGTTVTLAHSEIAGTDFIGWSGSCTGTGSCVVTMCQARNVTATFNLTPVVDVCTNLEGAQSSTPEGYVNNDGICTVIVPPVDMCPNISGNQSEVPSGMQIVEGQCVEIVAPPEDMCPNIEGLQATIPSGKQLVEGQCVDIVVPVDVCTNIEGLQLVTPEGMTNNEGMCTLIVPPTDVCNNLEGVQISTPEGYVNNEGMCTPIEVPPTDVCTNIEGVQEQTPEGMTNNEGTCTENSTPAPTPEPTPTTGGGLLWGNFTPTTPNSAPQGQVLGASTSCGVSFTKSLRRGYKNDEESVKKLQRFLNEYMSAGLTENGVFDSATENALKAFQLKYASTILTPWGLTTPTGVLHTTTRTQINNLMCPDLKLPVPTQLIPMTRQDL